MHAVNFNQRFYPNNLHARELIAGGTLGDVRMITGGYLQDWLLYDTDWSWRLEREQGGDLRVVGDIGSHWLDLAGYLTGRRVDAVMADLTTFMPVRKEPVGHVETFATEVGGETRDRAIETEDAAGLLVRFEGGARAVVTLSQVSAGRKNHLHWEVNGSQASAAWDAERPEELWIGHRERPNELASARPRQARAVRRGALEHARRPRRGLRRDVPRALPRRLHRGRGGRSARGSRTIRPSPTGTSRRWSATRSRARTRRAGGSRWRADGRHLRLRRDARRLRAAVGGDLAAGGAAVRLRDHG